MTRHVMMTFLGTRRFPTEFHRIEAENRVEQLSQMYVQNNNQDLLCHAFDAEIARWQEHDGLVRVHLGLEARAHMHEALYKYEQNLRELAVLHQQRSWLLIALVILAVGLIGAATLATFFVARE